MNRLSNQKENDELVLPPIFFSTECSFTGRILNQQWLGRIGKKNTKDPIFIRFPKRDDHENLLSLRFHTNWCCFKNWLKGKHTHTPGCNEYEKVHDFSLCYWKLEPACYTLIKEQDAWNAIRSLTHYVNSQGIISTIVLNY